MSNETGIEGLLDNKKRLESVIEVYQNKIAVVRKRIEALTTAINVLRSSDEELEAIVAGLPTKSIIARKYPDENLSQRIIEYAVDHPNFKTRELKAYFTARGISWTSHAIYKTLNSGKFYKSGERDLTSYKLKTDNFLTNDAQ